MNTPRILILALLAAGIASAQDNPAPASVANPAQTEMQKWIADLDAQWQATFKRDVSDPFSAELDKLKIQYRTSIEAGIKKASDAGDLDGALALLPEQKRFAGASDVPPQDDAADPPPVKLLRAAWRAQIAQMEKDRAARAKALLAKYDQVLAQAQTALAQRQRLDDALLVKAKRDEVAAAWLAGTAAPASPAIAVEQPKPPSTIPAKPLVPVKPPAGQKVEKMDERALDAKLGEMGCGRKFGDAGKRRGLFRVEFNNREFTEEDFAIFAQLGGIRELGIRRTSATDAMIEQARACRKVTDLSLADLPKMSGRGFQIVASMPELKKLFLYRLNLDDAGFKSAMQGSSVERIDFNLVSGLTDPSLATLGELPSLQSARLTRLIGFTPAGWLSLSKAKKLTNLELVGLNPGADGFANLARCPTLESLSIEEVPVTDQDVQPVRTMRQLGTFHVKNTKVTDAFLASLNAALPKLRIVVNGKRR